MTRWIPTKKEKYGVGKCLYLTTCPPPSLLFSFASEQLSASTPRNSTNFKRNRSREVGKLKLLATLLLLLFVTWSDCYNTVAQLGFTSFPAGACSPVCPSVQFVFKWEIIYSSVTTMCEEKWGKSREFSERISDSWVYNPAELKLCCS